MKGKGEGRERREVWKDQEERRGGQRRSGKERRGKGGKEGEGKRKGMRKRKGGERNRGSPQLQLLNPPLLMCLSNDRRHWFPLQGLLTPRPGKERRDAYA